MLRGEIKRLDEECRELIATNDGHRTTIKHLAANNQELTATINRMEKSREVNTAYFLVVVSFGTLLAGFAISCLSE
jgi:hypothetical protein